MVLITYKFIQHNNNPLAITQNYIYIEPISSFYRQEHRFAEKIDYHDYAYLEREKARIGLPGENGQPGKIKDESVLLKTFETFNDFQSTPKRAKQHLTKSFSTRMATTGSSPTKLPLTDL